MAKRLEQTQRAIDAMKAAGFKHGSWKKGGEFRVETPLNRQYMAYTDTYIYTDIRNEQERIEEAMPALLSNGLGVYTIVLSDGRKSHSVTAQYEAEGKQIVIDYNNPDKWGIPTRTTRTLEEAK